jgi:hypothetical protein
LGKLLGETVNNGYANLYEISITPPLPGVTSETITLDSFTRTGKRKDRVVAQTDWKYLPIKDIVFISYTDLGVTKGKHYALASASVYSRIDVRAVFNANNSFAIQDMTDLAVVSRGRMVNLSPENLSFVVLEHERLHLRMAEYLAGIGAAKIRGADIHKSVEGSGSTYQEAKAAASAEAEGYCREQIKEYKEKLEDIDNQVQRKYDNDTYNGAINTQPLNLEVQKDWEAHWVNFVGDILKKNGWN